MSDAPRLNVLELTVSELSARLKRTIEEAYGHVRVRGELGNVKYHSSGHIYLDLKDDRACITGVIWRSTAPRIRLRLEAGLEVVVTGRITTYPGQSKYQLIIDTLEPAGPGALMAMVEERKRRLAAEGLFDAARKRPLPFLPGVIGVITSPTGAVIRDILHRLSDRFPRSVLLWPVRVQGEGAAEEVAAAIRGFNALAAAGPVPRPDLLIVARGGGSLEDLWAFNEEVVVRAAAASAIPLIAAVGHETDVTLIDFAADRRAPTPTAAAEMAVPVRAELIARLDSLARRHLAAWLRAQEARRMELRAALRALPDADDLLALPRQRLDGAAERLPLALRANAQLHHTQFSRITARLGPASLRARMAHERRRLANAGERGRNAIAAVALRRRERFAALAQRLAAGWRAHAHAHGAALRHDRTRLAALIRHAQQTLAHELDRRAAHLAAAGQLLAAYSYRGVLARGFALVRDETGHPLRAAAAVTEGMRLDIEFADGHVRAVAGETPPAPPAARPRRQAGSEGQGSLFD